MGKEENMGLTDKYKIRLDLIINFGLAISVVMIICCVVVFALNVFDFTTKKPNPHTPTQYTKNIDYGILNDTISNNVALLTTQTRQLQNAVKELQYADSITWANIETRQADLVNDVRQETNNIINKFNAWLAFWITILTFISVFLPLIYNYKLSKDLKKQSKEIDKKIKEWEELKKELTEERKKTESQLRLHRLNAMSQTVQNCINYRLLSELNNFEDFIRNRWNNAIQEFSSIINKIFKDSESFHEIYKTGGVNRENIRGFEEEILYSLMNLRVLLAQVYRTSKDSQINHREYEELTRLIVSLMSDFASDKIYEPYLRNRFKCLIDRLARIYN